MSVTAAKQQNVVRKRLANCKPFVRAMRKRHAERKRRQTSFHPLDDPEGFAAGVRALTNQAVRQVQTQTQAQQDRVVETLSRNALKRHIGAEQFTELEQFAKAAPDRAHDLAYESGDPWGWMYEKLQEPKKQRQAQAALQELGDKSLQDRIAEAVAAERAKWEAEHGGGQPQRLQRNPSTTAAPAIQTALSLPQPTKRNATSHHHFRLVVTGAPAPRGADAMSGYDNSQRNEVEIGSWLRQHSPAPTMANSGAPRFSRIPTRIGLLPISGRRSEQHHRLARACGRWSDHQHPVLPDLTGDGVAGNAVLEGNEEGARSQERASHRFLRHATKFTKRTQSFVNFDVCGVEDNW